MKRRINPLAAPITLQQNQQTKPSQADGLMLERDFLAAAGVLEQ